MKWQDTVVQIGGSGGAIELSDGRRTQSVLVVGGTESERETLIALVTQRAVRKGATAEYVGVDGVLTAGTQDACTAAYTSQAQVAEVGNHYAERAESREAGNEGDRPLVLVLEHARETFEAKPSAWLEVLRAAAAGGIAPMVLVKALTDAEFAGDEQIKSELTPGWLVVFGAHGRAAEDIAAYVGVMPDEVEELPEGTALVLSPMGSSKVRRVRLSA